MNVFAKILDALFPENFTCELCGKEIFDGGKFCKKCAERVIFNNGKTCPVCGRKTLTAAICLECKASAPQYARAVSALVYADGAAALVNKFKNGGAYLKNYFARLLCEKCRQFEDADCVCFVPMTKKAERKRGYNQSYLIAKELAKTLKLPLLKNAVEKVKETPSQKTLSKREREENLRSCFRADRQIVEGRTIIVVDDVLTTGATVEAISVELLKRGAKRVYVATVASVEYSEKKVDVGAI